MHDLVISSLVGSGHPDKYSYQISHEYLSGKGNLSRKIYLINLLLLFQMVICLPAYLATFSGQLYFQRSYFFTFLQSKYFDTTVTFSEQLSLQSSCFLGKLPFQKSLFLIAFIFSQYLIFRGQTFTKQLLLENRNNFSLELP